MSHSLMVRRGVGATGAAVLAVAGLSLSPPPASAAAVDGVATAGTTFSTSGGGGCALSSDTHTSSNQPFGSSGAVASFNLNTSAVATDPADPLVDTTQLAANIAGTVSAQESAGAVTGFGMNANIALKVDRAQDLLSSCSSTSSATMVMAMPTPFTVPAPTLLDLTTKYHGNLSLGATTLLFTKIDAPTATVTEVPTNFNMSVHRYVMLPAGHYTATVVVTTQLAQPAPAPTSESGTATWSLDADFLTPGIAKTTQQGTGSKYLTLGGAVSCAGHSVTADFTSKAGKKPKHGKKPVLKKATFYVNDAKVASVKKPNQNTLTTLTGLPAEDEVTVEAVIKVHGKGVVDVRRTYRPCS